MNISKQTLTENDFDQENILIQPGWMLWADLSKKTTLSLHSIHLNLNGFVPKFCQQKAVKVSRIKQISAVQWIISASASFRLQSWFLSEKILKAEYQRRLFVVMSHMFLDQLRSHVFLVLLPRVFGFSPPFGCYLHPSSVSTVTQPRNAILPL